MGKSFQSYLFEPTSADKVKNDNNYFDELLHLFHANDISAGWPDVFGDALHNWSMQTLENPVRTLSLFSGGGGLDIAFRDAGFHAVKMIELDPRFVETLQTNSRKGGIFEGTEPVCIDIKDFYPENALNIDFIIGGPPCQTFSAAGRRAAGVSGLDDPRGNLFREYVRILEKLKPAGFVFENVYGIIGAQNGKAWQEIIGAFEAAGYTVSYRILDAADYGVPQHRERLIIVGTRDKKFAFPRPTHGPDSSNQHPYYIPGLAVQGVGDEKPKIVSGRYGHLLQDIPPGLNYSFYTEEMGHPTPHFSWRSKFSDLLYKADPDMPIRTIKAQGGQYTGPFHWENRPFSVGELKRLQTFPDHYTLAGGRLAAIHQIGNSVPPQLGRILAIAILNQLFGMNFPFEISYLSDDEELTFRQRKTHLTAVYRNKAKKAIDELYQNETTGSFNRNKNKTTYAAYMGPDFLWLVHNSDGKNHEWNVHFSVVQDENCLNITIENTTRLAENNTVEISIVPTEKWGLPTREVRLFVQEASMFMLTAAWKAFEHYIATQGIKADLVQLNGYYQYDPKIKIQVLNFTEAKKDAKLSWQWDGLKYVLEGKGTRSIISLPKLAEVWKFPLDKTVDALLELKKVGYEVRSEYTNNQIPSGHVLIPYAFPTLNKNSVQLRKALFPPDFWATYNASSQEESVTTVDKELWKPEDLWESKEFLK